jgi:hypothetical protein
MAGQRVPIESVAASATSCILNCHFFLTLPRLPIVNQKAATLARSTLAVPRKTGFPGKMLPWRIFRCHYLYFSATKNFPLSFDRFEINRNLFHETIRRFMLAPQFDGHVTSDCFRKEIELK